MIQDQLLNYLDHQLTLLNYFAKYLVNFIIVIAKLLYQLINCLKSLMINLKNHFAYFLLLKTIQIPIIQFLFFSYLSLFLLVHSLHPLFPYKYQQAFFFLLHISLYIYQVLLKLIIIDVVVKFHSIYSSYNPFFHILFLLLDQLYQ